jgi:hypothetical protein
MVSTSQRIITLFADLVFVPQNEYKMQVISKKCVINYWNITPLTTLFSVETLTLNIKTNKFRKLIG